METYFKNLSAEEGTTDKLIQDLNTLIGDAEALIKSTGGNLADKSKDELVAGLERLKTSCRRIEQKAATGAQSVDKYIRENPYQTVGVALGAGLILGLLLGRD